MHACRASCQASICTGAKNVRYTRPKVTLRKGCQFRRRPQSFLSQRFSVATGIHDGVYEATDRLSQTSPTGPFAAVGFVWCFSELLLLTYR
jgi:hypothetical protein